MKRRSNQTLLIIPAVFLIAAGIGSISCGNLNSARSPELDSIAVQYVKLVLQIGVWDPGYVDAYYGPEGWRPDPKEYDSSSVFPVENLRAKASNLIEKLERIDSSSLESMQKLRLASLKTQLISVRGVIDLMSGKKMTFDEESRVLYDAVVPQVDTRQFTSILAALDSLVPGKGPLTQRMSDCNKRFEIPRDKLPSVIAAAIEESRRRTRERIDLPNDERFTVDYVSGQPWGAYNWYKGNYTSLIEINTDLPKRIGSPVVTGAHEGYPGHHVYQVLLEKRMVEEMGWIEFSVFPIFSPQGLIAEGSANFGVDIVFPGKERERFEKSVLFPMSGLDTSSADLYFRIRDLRRKLRFAGIFAGREYLDGRMNRQQTVDWLVNHTLSTTKEAEKRIDFFDKYRSYIINYSYGEELVKNWIAKNGGTDENPAKRWDLFYELISTPQTPSGIQ